MRGRGGGAEADGRRGLLRQVPGAGRAIGTPPAGCAITYKRRGVRMDYTVPLRKEIRRMRCEGERVEGPQAEEGPRGMSETPCSVCAYGAQTVCSLPLYRL